jgi:signal transduction histidine kinase
VSADRLGVLAHELRSPVAALVALAERARAGGLPRESLDRVLALALEAGRDVERLLRDPSVSSVKLERVEVGELLRAVAGPRVTVSAQRATLSCDPTRVRQALANLVANGLRHGTAVTVTASSEGGHAVIDVADDGPGVAAGVDVFARGVSGSGSTGYGLWIARAIAEAHGGSLDLVPVSRGATFRLVLPLACGG